MVRRTPSQVELARKGQTVSTAERQAHTLTFPLGGTETNTVDLFGAVPVGLAVPVGYEAGTLLRFSVSINGVDFFTLMESSTTPVELDPGAAVAGIMLALTAPEFKAGRFLKILSVDALGDPLVQSAAKDVIIVAQP